MPTSALNLNAKFVAKINDVLEVALVTTADLTYWQRHIAHLNLFPYNRQGRAKLILSATAFRWFGRLRNEFTIALAVSVQPDGATYDGLLLVQAFNASRMLAWMERTMFHTPYDPGCITVTAQPELLIALRNEHEFLIEARLNPVSEPITQRFERWHGPLFLPATASGPRRFFVAELSGETAIYPFGATSTLQIATHNNPAVLPWLRASDIAGSEWRVRRAAFHARSRTFEHRPSNGE